MKNNAKLDKLLALKLKLDAAVSSKRSEKWCLAIWSRYIRARDDYRCVICSNSSSIQAHHIIRRVVYLAGQFQLGNGISLCRRCHQYLHTRFNGRPKFLEPLNYRGGDDQDEIAFLYGALLEDAEARGLDKDLFYFISDEMLAFFSAYQGYTCLYDQMRAGKITRIRGTHEIWRIMPEEWYAKLAAELGQVLLLKT